MRPILNNLSQKSILILGLGREGLSSYKFLRSQFPKKVLGLADAGQLSHLKPEFQEIIRNDQKVKQYIGNEYLDQLEKFEVIVKAPGIPKTLPKIEQAIASGIQLTSNSQLFFDLCPAKIIGVTGTKGKSTTTALIYHVLHQNEIDSVLVGNIGKPPLSSLEQIKPTTWVVCELSSHQLVDMHSSPHIAVVQTMTSEHLDHFKSEEEYFASKNTITKYQTADDFVIYNPKLEKVKKVASLSSGKHLHYFVEANSSTSPPLPLEANEIPLRGHHNLFNVLPAVMIGQHLGLTNTQIARAIKSFKSLPHRLEFVCTVDGVEYFNDAIATNPLASAAAIRSFSNRNLIVIAGGHERNQDFTPFVKEILAHKVRAMILFPHTGTRLGEAIKTEATKLNLEINQQPQQFTANSMPEALEIAKKTTHSGDVVLLSPASASFTLFKDFEDEGNQFREWVTDQ